MRSFTGLRISCDRKIKGQTCSFEQVFDNPDGLPPYILEREAILAGWYLPLGLAGTNLCPRHHAEVAATYKLKSLYDETRQTGIKIERQDSIMSAKSKEEA